MTERDPSKGGPPADASLMNRRLFDSRVVEHVPATTLTRTLAPLFTHLPQGRLNVRLQNSPPSKNISLMMLQGNHTLPFLSASTHHAFRILTLQPSRPGSPSIQDVRRVPTRDPLLPHTTPEPNHTSSSAGALILGGILKKALKG